MTSSTDFDYEIDEEDVPPEDDSSPDQERRESYDFMDADLGDFLKKPKTQVAKDYEKKAQSVLSGLLKMTIRKPESLPDAATIIAYGDTFCSAVGDLAEADKRAAKAIDFITAPDNPYLVFAMTAIPFASQLIRNHQDSLETIPVKIRNRRVTTKAERKAMRDAKPGLNIKIPFTKRTFKIRIALHMGILTSQSVDPKQLTHSVFNNADVVKQLEKRGIHIGRP